MDQKNKSSEEMLDIAKKIIETSTTKPTAAEKFKSRKFWVAIAGVVAGICGIFDCNDNTTAIIVFAIVELISVVMYCITEGSIDRTRISGLLDSALTLIAMINGNEHHTVEEILEDDHSDDLC